MNYEELTDIFRRLGAPNPESWARSQVDEGIPQLARFAFLQQAWGQSVLETDPTGREMRSPEAGGI